MEKYIRTKAGIYKERIDRYIENNNLYQIGYNQPGRIYLGEVITQADTIEELCDMYVLADDEFKHIDLVSDYNDVRQMLSYDLFGQSCYGAIWTKDGLKFVAKRNCFGELELI